MLSYTLEEFFWKECEIVEFKTLKMESRGCEGIKAAACLALKRRKL